MPWINEAVLDVFRHWPECEWCKRPLPDGADPAHIFSRGAGRVDIPENVCALCRECHSSNHAGNRPRTLDLMIVSGHREKMLAEDIQQTVWDLRRYEGTGSRLVSKDQRAALSADEAGKRRLAARKKRRR